MTSDFDVFLSHTTTDKPFAWRLALDLRKEALSVWFDEWELGPGDSLHEKIAQAISTSGYVAVVLSPDSVKSRWVQVEINAAFARELELKSVFLVPILYRPCNIPSFLKDKVYADFTKDYDAGLRNLLKGLKPLEARTDPKFTFAPIENKALREQVQTILDEVAGTLRTNVSLITADARRVCATIEPHPEYYELLSNSTNPSLHPAAREWDAFQLTAQRRASLQSECAWCCTDICVPIFVRSNVVAVFFTGQHRGRDPDDTILASFRDQEREDGLEPGRFVRALKKVKPIDRKGINAGFTIGSQAARKIARVFEKHPKYLSQLAPLCKRECRRAGQGHLGAHNLPRKILPTKAPSRRRGRRD